MNLDSKYISRKNWIDTATKCEICKKNIPNGHFPINGHSICFDCELKLYIKVWENKGGWYLVAALRQVVEQTQDMEKFFFEILEKKVKEDRDGTS